MNSNNEHFITVRELIKKLQNIDNKDMIVGYFQGIEFKPIDLVIQKAYYSPPNNRDYYSSVEWPEDWTKTQVARIRRKSKIPNNQN
jgi:hypothetical protein